MKAHGSLASLWTPPLKANVSLESSISSHTLLMSATCGRQNVSFTAAVSGADKVGGDSGLGELEASFIYSINVSICLRLV